MFDDALNAVPAPDLSAFSGPEAKQRRWEHRVVKKLLEHYGMQRHAPALMTSNFGTRSLSFRAFKESFPGFPVWLACHKIPYVFKTEVKDLLRRFDKSRPFRAFERAEAQAPEAYREGRLALVFEWVGVWQECVISNYYHGTPPGSSAFFYEFPGTQPPQLFGVQAFSSFLHKLPWSPPE